MADAREGSAAPMLDLCECGHPRERHWRPLARCAATVDKRHVTAGGPTLCPCDCKGFVPMVKERETRKPPDFTVPGDDLGF